MPIPSSPPLVKLTNFILNKGGDTIQFNRRPAFSNTFELNKVRIFHDTNDIVISFRDPNWPKYNILQFDLFPLTGTFISQLITFIKNHLGEVVNMTINNIVYAGVITEPKIEIIDERNDECNYKISISFETQVCL